MRGWRRSAQVIGVAAVLGVAALNGYAKTEWQNSSRIRLWYGQYEAGDSDFGQNMLYMLSHDLFVQDERLPLAMSLSALVGYGTGWDYDTDRFDMQGSVNGQYSYFYFGVGGHLVNWTWGDDDQKGSLGGLELLLGASVPLGVDTGFWLRGQYTTMPYVAWRGEDTTPGEAFDDNGSTTGYTWDAGLAWKRNAFILGVGYRAMHFDADRVTHDDGRWAEIYESDFNGPYIEGGMVW